MSRKNIDGAGIKRSRWREIWRLFRKNRPAMIGLVLLILILLVSIFADVIVPYDTGLLTSAQTGCSHPVQSTPLARTTLAETFLPVWFTAADTLL